MSSVLIFCANSLHSAEYSVPACLQGAPVAIVVRIGAEAVPRRAWLRGGTSPPLQIVDADTAQPIWSAAAKPPADQQFDALQAQFAGSLLPLDLNGDGTHDRIYAGDLAGRLWRFDLHHGLPPERWATGGVFADLSWGLARGFLAAPDVSLAGSVSSPRWFNITLGTARIGNAFVDNRLYVLRDHAPFEAWTQHQYDRWRALREVDLVQLPQLGATLSMPAPNGYFVAIGGADMLSASLTVAGRATLALVEPGTNPGANCSVATVVSTLDLATAREYSSGPAGSRPQRTPAPMVAGEAFALRREGNRAKCMIGETHIPACDVDLSPRRTWWRREDAD